MTLDMQTAPKTDQLNYDNIPNGKTITITVTRVTENPDPKQPRSVHYEGDNGKPYKPGLSMRRILEAGWGNDGHKYVGRSMTLFGEPTVRFGPNEVGGIRISYMTHMEEDLHFPLTVSRGRKEIYIVKQLKMDMEITEDEIDEDELMKEARGFAEGGKPNFVTWFNTLNQAQRDIVKANMDELQKICGKAESTSEEDPFKVQATEEAEASPSREPEGEAVAKGEPKKQGKGASGSPTPIEDVSKWLSRAQIRDAIDDCRTEDELDTLLTCQSLGIKSKSETDQIEINNAVIDRKKVISNA